MQFFSNPKQQAEAGTDIEKLSYQSIERNCQYIQLFTACVCILKPST